MPKNKKITSISTSKAMQIVAKSVPDITFATISALVAIHPVLILLFLTGKSIYSAWGDFGQARLNELVVELEKSKGSFNTKILETDEFKSVFLSTLERHMKESSDRKRKLLRNYLISVGQGKMPSFDYHTKLLNILDQITGYELRLFMLLPNIIKDSDNEMAYLSLRSQTIFDKENREINMNVLQVKMRLKDWKIKKKDLSALVRFLTNYGLVISQDTSVSGIGGGGSTDIIFQGITDIGLMFYKSIDDSTFNKEITPYTVYQENPTLSVEVFRD